MEQAVQDTAAASRVYDILGGIDRRPVGLTRRLRGRVERLSPLWGGLLVIGIAVGLFAGALAGVTLALAGNGSLIFVVLGVPVMVVSAATAAHLTPPRVTDLLD
ncbi:MAG: hypothetical protein L3K17_09670 [Thermoplasmata archaeon]|nr:hypothetical protein [Thermoplasmata archaeon]MCI4337432.1 hypothetical protein [Thermoplasmata archaeon]